MAILGLSRHLSSRQPRRLETMDAYRSVTLSNVPTDRDLNYTAAKNLRNPKVDQVAYLNIKSICSFRIYAK